MHFLTILFCTFRSVLSVSATNSPLCCHHHRTLNFLIYPPTTQILIFSITSLSSYGTISMQVQRGHEDQNQQIIDTLKGMRELPITIPICHWNIRISELLPRKMQKHVLRKERLLKIRNQPHPIENLSAVIYSTYYR